MIVEWFEANHIPRSTIRENNICLHFRGPFLIKKYLYHFEEIYQQRDFEEIYFFAFLGNFLDYATRCGKFFLLKSKFNQARKSLLAILLFLTLLLILLFCFSRKVSAKIVPSGDNELQAESYESCSSISSFCKIFTIYNSKKFHSQLVGIFCQKNKRFYFHENI